ncbi:MAG: fumarylacetoacetate hydrolase family protein [Bacteroidales bacterium]
MKIICVGWNYPDHNKEMDRKDLPSNPTLFMKPDTSLLKDGKPFFIPDFSDRIEYETEIVIRIDRVGKNISEKFASRYYDAVTVGIDFTARDLQASLREKGQPWEISKAFDNSAVIGEFIPAEGLDMDNIHFSMNLNGENKQTGCTNDMIFRINKIISYASQFFTLKKGDLIFTGTPSGVGPVKIDDHIEGYIDNTKLLDFRVK